MIAERDYMKTQTATPPTLMQIHNQRTCTHCGETHVPHVTYYQQESTNWLLLILVFIIFFPAGILLLIFGGSSRLVPLYVCPRCGSTLLSLTAGEEQQRKLDSLKSEALYNKSKNQCRNILVAIGVSFACLIILGCIGGYINNSHANVIERLQQQRVADNHIDNNTSDYLSKKFTESLTEERYGMTLNKSDWTALEAMYKQ